MSSLKSESVVQQEIMIEAAKHGITLMRNNSGALKDESGRVVRYGLMNESEVRNKQIKSSDLIGVWMYPEPLLGKFFGIFIAIEVKKEGWKFNPNDQREQAQLAFINFIRAKGGVAGFCASVVDFLKLIGKA